MTPTSPDLLRILRAPPGVACDPLDDPEGMLLSAERHGLSGVLELAKRDGRFSLTPAQGERLVMSARGLAVTALRCRKVLHSALDALAEEGIVPVLLKGLGLAQRLWPEPLLRPTSDVDLLVEPEALDAAQGALARAGYVIADAALAHFQRRFHHHLSLVGPHGVVELHFRINAGQGRPLDLSDVSAPSAATLDGRTVRYLQPVDEWPYLAVHASVSRFKRLSWLWELRSYVEKERGLLAEVGPTWLRERRLQVAFWCAVDATERLFGLPGPAVALRAQAPSRAHRAVLRRFFGEDRLLGGPGELPPWREQALSVLLCDDVPSALGFAGGHLSHVARRRLAARWPDRVPWHWRG